MGADHPVTWCKDYKGGRSYYTNHGASAAAWSDANLVKELVGALVWASGQSDPDYSDCGATVLANYQQVKISSPPNVSEPIGFDQLPDGRVIQTDRRGGVRLHNPTSGTTTTILANIPVYTNSEDGLYGPGDRQQLRQQQLGLPLLRPAGGHRHHLLGRHDRAHERLHGSAVPERSCPDAGHRHQRVGCLDRLLPAVALQVRRRRTGSPGSPGPLERAADHPGPEQPRSVLPRGRRHRLRQEQQPLVRHGRRQRRR